MSLVQWLSDYGFDGVRRENGRARALSAHACEDGRALCPMALEIRDCVDDVRHGCARGCAPSPRGHVHAHAARSDAARYLAPSGRQRPTRGA